MILTGEFGRYVTPERIRADGEKMERDGFRLVYECPIEATDEERRFYVGYWRAVTGCYISPGPAYRRRMA